LYCNAVGVAWTWRRYRFTVLAR